MGLVPTFLSLMGLAWAQGIVFLDQGEQVDEDRFQAELAMTINDVQVHPAPTAFAGQPMANQLDQVRPMLEGSARQAVVWFDATDAERLWVSVAFVESERAVIRMIDLAREPDAIPQLALAVRELVSSIYAEEEPPPPPPPPPTPPPAPRKVVWVTGSAGIVWPSAPHAGGLRGALSGAIERQWNEVGLAGEVHAQAGKHQGRFGPAAALRWRWVTAGAQLDWVRLSWAAQLQPRVFVGGVHRWDRGATLGGRLYVAPIRDRVVRDGDPLYDSGWIAVSIFFGWGRKISTL